MAAPARMSRGRGRLSSAASATAGEALSWVAALVLALSTFMGWYSGSESGIPLSAIGWHTGIVGKLVLLVGLAALALLTLRATGTQLPPNVPVGMLVAVLGGLGTTLVVIRVLEVPDDYFDFGRSAGLWISLVAALLLIAGGLLASSEEA